MIKINITARHFKAHETLQEYIKSKIDGLEKFNEEILHAEVVLSFEKALNSVKICEIIMKLRDKTITSKENSDEFPKAIDKAVNKIETQLLKYKDKHKVKRIDKLDTLIESENN
ncbi:MAG: ribosome-associated translation inhibitor RaiA [Ignavibacteria bacterium]